jgi:FG-GAP-like repeat
LLGSDQTPMKTRIFCRASFSLLWLCTIQMLVAQTTSKQSILANAPERIREVASRGNTRFTSPSKGSSKSRRPRPDATGGPTPVSFISATRIESDGDAIYPVLKGRFNSDTLPDVVTIIRNTGTPSGAYVAVLLNVSGQSLSAPILTPVSFAAGDFMLVADLNQDSIDDVVLVHPNSMDVLLSVGDGTFAAPQTFATAIDSPVAASLWDVNHDTFLDVAIVDGTSTQAAYLSGDGHGGFAAAQLRSFPATTAIAVLADLDADGNLDLITNDTLYPGDGSGGFLAGVAFSGSDGQNAGATSSGSIGVGDLNKDGRLDVVTVNGLQNTVSVYINQVGGRSLVQQGASMWSGNDPVAVAIADVNSDTKPDVIVTNAAESDVSVFIGQGDGSLRAATPGFATGGSPSTRAVLADFNGDGFLDVVISDNQSSIVLALGNGDGTFQAAPVTDIAVPAGSSNLGGAISIASADFDGNLAPDFVVGQSSATPGLGLVVFLTQADGTLSNGVAYAQNDSLSYVAVGAFISGGHTDIVASNSKTPSLEVLRGNGDGTFQTPISIALPTIANGLVVADFNGDGFPDVAAAGQYSVYILLNDGAGNLTLARTYPISGIGTELVAADINKDGRTDLCITMSATSRVAVLLGSGTGSFTSLADFDTTMASTYGIAAGDLNGDSSVDLVVTSPTDGFIAIALGNGDGSFNSPHVYSATRVPSPLNPSPQEVALSDVNGDGKLDIVYANSGDSSIGVFVGDGSGNFWPAEFPMGGGASGLVIADVNGDGLPDVVTADAHFSGVSVAYNHSGSHPPSNFVITGTSGVMAIAPGGSVTTLISLSGNNGFIGSVELACPRLPAMLSCLFVPSSLHLVKGVVATSQLTIAASQTNAALPVLPRAMLAWAIMPILGGLFLSAWGCRRIPRSAGVAMVASLVFVSGCQAIAPTQTPKAYTITVTATAWNGISHSIPMQVSAQQ